MMRPELRQWLLKLDRELRDIGMRDRADYPYVESVAAQVRNVLADASIETEVLREGIAHPIDALGRCLVCPRPRGLTEAEARKVVNADVYRPGPSPIDGSLLG